MNPVTAEQAIDVTAIPPRQKHPTILAAWNDLEAGGALILINDHDPLPLYYQFACEHQGGFHWEYLEQGPDTWRVRIAKGAFAEPGFVPARKVAPAPAACAGPVAALEVDTRPIFQRGETPCGAIDEAVAALIPGQALVLLVPFEPVPLYTKLGREGFQHKPEQLADGTWRVEFRR